VRIVYIPYATAESPDFDEVEWESEPIEGWNDGRYALFPETISTSHPDRRLAQLISRNKQKLKENLPKFTSVLEWSERGLLKPDGFADGFKLPRKNKPGLPLRDAPLTNDTLYVLVHGSRQSPVISKTQDGQSDFLYPEELAVQMIFDGLPKSVRRIKLLCCYGAKQHNANTSENTGVIAHRLAKALTEGSATLKKLGEYLAPMTEVYAKRFRERARPVDDGAERWTTDVHSPFPEGELTPQSISAAYSFPGLKDLWVKGYLGAVRTPARNAQGERDTEKPYDVVREQRGGRDTVMPKGQRGFWFSQDGTPMPNIPRG
jgi:hypothetical protein